MKMPVLKTLPESQNIDVTIDKIKKLKIKEIPGVTDSLKKKPVIIFYNCEKCKNKIIDCFAFEGDSKTCSVCNIELIKTEEFDATKITLIAKFSCEKCNKQWRKCMYLRNSSIICYGCNAVCDPKELLLTPYQGSRRSFGWYKCYNCADKQWTSAYSWKNSYQMCNGCDSEVFPYKQFKIQGPGKEGRPSHKESLCGKCLQLGHHC